MRTQDIDETYPMLLKVLKALRKNKETEYIITPEDWPGETEDIVNAFNEFIQEGKKDNEVILFSKSKQNKIKLNITENPTMPIEKQIEMIQNQIILENL